MAGYTEVESPDGGARYISNRPDAETARYRALKQIQCRYAGNPGEVLASKSPGLHVESWLGYWNYDNDWVHASHIPGLVEELEQMVVSKQEGEPIYASEVLAPVSARLDAIRVEDERKAEEARKHDQEEVRFDGESCWYRIRGKTGDRAYAVVGQGIQSKWIPVQRHPDGYWVQDFSREVEG